MYREKSRRCGTLMLTVSICLRLCMFLGLDTKLAELACDVFTSRDFVRWMLFLETGQAAPADLPKEDPTVLVLRYMEPEEQNTNEQEPTMQAVPIEVQITPEPVVPTKLAAAEEIAVAGGCTYPIDKTALLEQTSTLDFSGDGPQILIVHTHGSEAYTPDAGNEYAAITDYRTLDSNQSVIAVGDALAETLASHGISVLHDRSINDYPSYNDSYWTTLQKIENWLEQYPNIQMVLDIHRDAVTTEAGQAVALSSAQNGQTAAQLMLVVGTDQGGLQHPLWQENLANALKLQSVLQGQYPGLCRKMDLRTERFNQHATPGSLLIEVGTNGNTLPQAIHAAELLGDGLARMIHALTENGGTLTG